MGHAPSISEAAGRLQRTALLAAGVSRLRYASRFSGAAGGGALARLDIERARDLLLHIPTRYSDYSRVVPIALAQVGSDATIIATVDKVELKHPKPRLQLVELALVDDSGIMLATFFRQPWVADQIQPGDCIMLSGKVRFGYGFRRMNPAFWEKLDRDNDQAHLARLIPHYALTEGLGAGWMRRLTSAALADIGDVCDLLPATLLAHRQLMGLAPALRAIHYPDSKTEAEQARRRLAYDELLCLQLTLRVRQRLQDAGVQPVQHCIHGEHLHALTAALPFKLSDEQSCASREILQDMAAPQVMNRLLLGDVGTGKTVVAALALAACADSRTQAAMMAPTSVLARQYAEKLGPLLDRANISWALLTSATSSSERADMTEAIAAGKCSIVFGTTALLSDTLQFHKLSLVVVDEQHRFGVDQRVALRRKGPGADLLAMTATPIPRTLALTFYGDMDSSIIKKRPLAGAGVTTRSVVPANLDLAWGAIRTAVASGQAAYVVCPLIDESDEGSDLEDIPETNKAATQQLHSVVSTLSEVQRMVPGAQVAMLTGRMSASDKDAVMEQFRRGEIQVLVCTTVVEVGVDVPQATVMLVFDSDRFGLATLHQLRGRVGRGQYAGSAWMVCAAKKNSPARRRIDALEATSDGFKLAELDLQLRHEGEVLGYRQHGGMNLQLSDLASDQDLIGWAHEDALALMQADPKLQLPEHAPLAIELRDRFGVYFEEVERV